MEYLFADEPFRNTEITERVATNGDFAANHELQANRTNQVIHFMERFL